MRLIPTSLSVQFSVGFWFALFAGSFVPVCVRTAGAAPSAETSIVIDEVNLLGVTFFSPKDLEKLVEMAPGDPLEQNKVVQTAKSIQELYRSSGYEEVRIESRLTQRAPKPGAKVENILEISVREGRPTRIAEVAVTYDIPLWQNRLKSVTARIGLKPGDLYDHERLLNGYRSVQDGLTGHDFLAPKVSDATVEPVAPPVGIATPELVANTFRWVKLNIKVDLGERVSFGYRGNTVFTNGQLSAWIDEQRLLGFSQDYIGRLRARFEDEYRKIGYDQASIEIFTFEDRENQRRKVTYAFREGPRIGIENVEFDGNIIFSNPVLYDKFYDLASPSVSRGYYVAKDIEKTAEVLVEWMKTQGYLAAKIISIAQSFRPGRDRVDLMIYIYEGDQTITESVNVDGLSVFSKEEITTVLQNAVGKPLNLYALNDGLEALKAKYRDQGYLDIRLKNEGTNELVLYSQENRLAEIHVEVEEGVQYRVSHIEIEGLRKTKREAVERELNIHEGEILSEREWYLSEAKLRRLGIFSIASIKAFPDPENKAGKILKVIVEEGSPGLVAGGFGFRNDIGGRVFSQIQYSNLWGKNHTVQLSATANRRFKNFGAQFCASNQERMDDPNHDHCFVEYNLTLGYVWPWFALGQTTFRPRLSLEKTQFKNFDANTGALQVGWERALLPKQGLTGGIAYSYEIIQQYNANDLTDNRRLKIGSITPSLVLDRRNNPLAPTKGTYTTLSWELARPEFGSQNRPPEDPPVAYSRLLFRNDLFLPLPKGIDLFLSFRTGLEYNLAVPPSEDPDNPRYGIPLIKQFTLGGVGSLRGFDEQSIFVDPNIAVRGSLTYVNYRAQVDLPFAGNMKFGPFIDAANLSLDRYTLGHLRVGVGAGFHYKSPVGPVNFDFGVNPKPKPGEENFRIHFSIGNI